MLTSAVSFSCGFTDGCWCLSNLPKLVDRCGKCAKNEKNVIDIHYEIKVSNFQQVLALNLICSDPADLIKQIKAFKRWNRMIGPGDPDSKGCSMCCYMTFIWIFYNFTIT